MNIDFASPGLARNVALFPPPSDSAALYLGTVMHQRLKPLSHRFRYRVYSLLIDLDALKEASSQSWFFSVDRFNLLSFRQKDHGDRKPGSLRSYVNGVLASAGITTLPTRVLLMCYPRVLGTVFNPISVYFAYDIDEQLVAVIYEVRNTFGEMHSYVAPVREGELDVSGLRQERDKRFYVSPFNDLQQRYFFRVHPPTDELSVRILQKDKDGPLLAATFHGKHRLLTNAAILRAFARIPFLTVTIVAGIHWEALKLWWKGLRIKARPATPAPLSFDDQHETA
jgi:uncharacterized protein